MKKISCKCCGNHWYIDDDSALSLNTCPYCSSSLRGPAALVQNYDRLSDALCAAFQIGGVDAIGDPRKLTNIMNDLAPKLQKEVRIFSKVITEDNVHFLVDAYHASSDTLDHKMKLLKQLLVDDEGLSVDWAHMLITSIHDAILQSKANGASGTLTGCGIEDQDEFVAPGSAIDPAFSQPAVHTRPMSSNWMISWDQIIWTDTPEQIVDTLPNGRFASITGSKIESHAYANNPGIVSLVIPASVKEIGKGAFENCRKLESIMFPSTVSEIGEGCFAYCASLKKVILPSSLTEIKRSVFSRCASLEDVRIPSGVTSIGPSAFDSCGSLVRIYIPTSVSSITKDAFEGCWKLKDIYYEGTEDEWNAIFNDDINYHLSKATCHFSYEGAAAAQRFTTK